jgi:hypothetical protein
VTRPIVEAEIIFRTQEEVGRKSPLVLNHPTARYRPHLTLNVSMNPERVPSSERLGIEFPRQCEHLTPSVPTVLQFQALFDGVDYSGLKAGAHFRILEGPLFVGSGHVIRVLNPT